MKIPNARLWGWGWVLSLARIVSEDSQLPSSVGRLSRKSSKDS